MPLIPEKEELRVKMGGVRKAAQSLLSIMMRANEGMSSWGLLSGIISLDHNKKEKTHEPRSEKQNNGNPSSSGGSA